MLTELQKIHWEDQLAGHWERFSDEWERGKWPEKLERVGYDERQLNQLKLQCWVQYLRRHGIEVGLEA